MFTVSVVILNAAHQLSSVKRELETERGKVAQLKRDVEGLKKKSKADQEKAARLVYFHMHIYILTFYLTTVCSGRGPESSSGERDEREGRKSTKTGLPKLKSDIHVNRDFCKVYSYHDDLTVNLVAPARHKCYAFT